MGPPGLDPKVAKRRRTASARRARSYPRSDEAADPAGRYLIYRHSRPGGDPEVSRIVSVETGQTLPVDATTLVWLYPRDGRSLIAVGDTLQALSFPAGRELASQRLLDQTRDATLHADEAGLYGATWRGEIFSWRFGATRPEWATPRARIGTQHVVRRLRDDRLVSAGRDGLARVWSRDGELLQTLGGHSQEIVDIAVDPTSNRFATRAYQEIRLWDPALAEDAAVLRGHTSQVYPVAFSPDGAWLATGGWDGVLRIWDVATRRERATVVFDEALAGRAVHEIFFDRDGTSVFAIARDSGVWQVDLTTGRRRQLLDAPNSRLALDPVRPRLVSLEFDYESDRGIVVLDLESREIVASRTVTSDMVSTFSVAAAYSPDGRWLAVALGDRRLRILDGETLEEQHVAELDEHVTKLCFSPDGSALALSETHGPIQLRKTTDWHLLTRLEGHVGKVYALAFHPDGTRLASGGDDGDVRIWDTSSHAELVQLKGHDDYVYSLAFSPDGGRLVSGSGDQTVRVWDTLPVSAVLAARTEYDAIVRRLQPVLSGWQSALVDGRRGIDDLLGSAALDDREREVARQLLLATLFPRRP